MRDDDLIQLRPEGLYCPPAELYIDPWKPVAHAVLTHAHADHARPGSTRYLAQRDAAPILRHRLGRDLDLTTVAYGEALDVKGVRVSLHPAGHILGSSQVRLEHEGRVWVVTGDFKRDEDPTCAPFEVVPCDAIITEATFALPVYRWRPPGEVIDAILAWWNDCAARGRNALLCCYALGKAQRVLAGLVGRAPRPVLLHGAMEPLVKVYRDAGVAMVETEPATDRPKERSSRARWCCALPRPRARPGRGASASARWASRRAGCRCAATAVARPTTAASRSRTTPTGPRSSTRSARAARGG
ncbi:MAG: hypothetical protein R3A52_18375 [Polyangiales bacterium]